MKPKFSRFKSYQRSSAKPDLILPRSYYPERRVHGYMRDEEAEDAFLNRYHKEDERKTFKKKWNPQYLSGINLVQSDTIQHLFKDEPNEDLFLK